jgi:DNA-binding NarL/FixJ family response regulator
VTPTAPRTVLLVEDHAMTRGLVQHALEGQGFNVVAVESARRAIREFDSIDPDVLVADIDLGERPNGVDLAAILRAQAPYLGVVFLSNFPSVDVVEGGFSPPARSSFVYKGSIDGPAPLVAAIEAALSDEEPAIRLTSVPANSPLVALSQAQMSVLRLLAEGWSNAEIAERRGITLRSTERAVSRIFATLGLGDDSAINARVAAVRMYVRAFGVPDSPRKRT